MRLLVCAGLLSTAACAASGPATLVADIPPLALDPSFTLTFSVSETGTFAVTVDPEDPTRLIGGVVDPAAGRETRGSLRFLDAMLPDGFILVTMPPPEDAALALGPVADHRIFALARCDANGILRAFRPAPNAQVLTDLPQDVGWDAEMRMLRFDGASDLTNTLSQLIRAGAYAETVRDRLPVPVFCDALFAGPGAP